tara:strand:+ start:221 stop:370 length:150 start_codon:yes stop_codon:yes gene_type:complete
MRNAQNFASKDAKAQNAIAEAILIINICLPDTPNLQQFVAGGTQRYTLF